KLHARLVKGCSSFSLSAIFRFCPGRLMRFVRYEIDSGMSKILRADENFALNRKVQIEDEQNLPSDQSSFFWHKINEDYLEQGLEADK
ncbi:21301_t:CDS:1, partial [Dentiscutata erythropus]